MKAARKDNDEAERLYRRALELGPDNATLTGNFANFMSEGRGDYGEAERFYRRAMELDPGNVSSTVNFVDFLLTRGRYAEASALSDRAWFLARGTGEIYGAGLTLYRGLLLLESARDDVPALGRLKTLLKGGFLRLRGSLDAVLGTASTWLSEDDRKLYAALADAIDDEQKVGTLYAFPRWAEVEPIPLDEPWEDLGS